MHTKTLQHNNVSHVQRDIFWATSIALVVTVALYCFFLAMSISNVAIRQDVNDKIVTLSSKVAQLEFQYVSLQNGVTSEVAKSKGYVAQVPVAYVAKESRLSLANRP